MKFLFKTYGLQELGLLYFPKSSPQSASMQLIKWIKRSDKLKSGLEEAGYIPGQKLLTPKQVYIIVDHIGEPG